MHAPEIKLVYGRKHPLRSNDIIALEATLTVVVEPDETEDEALLAGFRHMAHLLRQAVDEEIAQVKALAEQAIAQTADPPPGYAPAEPPQEAAQPAQATPAPAGPPRTPEEAERRFFARYGEIVGGESWLDVRSYLRMQQPKPTTVEGWIAAAEAVRDASRAAQAEAAPAEPPAAPRRAGRARAAA